MNRFLLCAALILCSQSVSALNLEPLCQGETFPYKTFTVNSVHKVINNLTLASVGTYLINDELDFTNWSNNETVVEQLETMKQEHNERITQIYNEQYLGTPTNLARIGNVIDELNQRKIDLQNASKNVKSEYQNNTDEIQKVLDLCVGLLENLTVFRDQVLKPAVMNLAHFKAMLEQLNIEDQNETMAFQNDRQADIYKRPIVKLEKFTLNRASKGFLDPRTTGTITFSISLPFYSKNYKPGPNPCLRGVQLPMFFARKIGRF